MCSLSKKCFRDNVVGVNMFAWRSNNENTCNMSHKSVHALTCSKSEQYLRTNHRCCLCLRSRLLSQHQLPPHRKPTVTWVVTVRLFELHLSFVYMLQRGLWRSSEILPRKYLKWVRCLNTADDHFSSVFLYLWHWFVSLHLKSLCFVIFSLGRHFPICQNASTWRVSEYYEWTA